MSNFCQRFDDMFKYATELGKDKSGQLSDEERNIIANAVKQVDNSRKPAIRQTEEIIKKKQSDGKLDQAEKAKEYKKKLVDEITKVCEEILTFIDKHLTASANSLEAQV